MTPTTRSDQVRALVDAELRAHAGIINKGDNPSVLHVRIWWERDRMRVRVDVRERMERAG